MDKPKLLINGSSWTVGAYQKSQLGSYDELVPGGIEELLEKYFDVTNISVQDDFNLGTSYRLNEHLKNNSYDKIIVCQNDALMDVNVLTTSNKEWAANFKFCIEELITNNIDTIENYIKYTLNKFYSQLPEKTYVFAGPSLVIDHLALANKIIPVQPDWVKALIPSYHSSFTYNHLMLISVLDLMLDIYPKNKKKLKEEFLEITNSIDRMINTWNSNPDYFANFHPTSLGNKVYFETVIKPILLVDS